jgi:Protein of unknown function (DUF4240)
MDEQTFWDLVGTIGPDQADFDRLTDELSDHGAADIRDFAEHLARALHALDTPAHYRAAGTTTECFLHVRAAAVAAGADAYRKVLNSPAALASFAPTGSALLPVAARAYETSTRGTWRHETTVSYETGSNRDAWGAHWLHPHMGTTTRDDRAPQAYMVALQHVALTLDGDPAWQAWWRQAGVSDCELGIVAEGRLDHLRPSADIRRAGTTVRANFTCSPPRYDGRPAELFPPAIAEITGMFEVIREAIMLPPLPVVPPLPALPPDARDLEVTTKPLPAVPPEVDQQGYLTLTQIQEFFG